MINNRTLWPNVILRVVINQQLYRPNSITFRSNLKNAARPHKEWPPQDNCDAGDHAAQWWTIPSGVVLQTTWEDGDFSYWKYKYQWDNVQPMRNSAQFEMRIPMRGCHFSTVSRSYTLFWEILDVS